MYAFDFLPKVELPQPVKYMGLIFSNFDFDISALLILQLNNNLTVFPTPKNRC